MAKKIFKTVQIDPQLHADLSVYKAELLAKGEAVSLADIVRRGLNCLKNKKAQS